MTTPLAHRQFLRLQKSILKGLVFMVFFRRFLDQILKGQRTLQKIQNNNRLTSISRLYLGIR